ncbi:MAG TPA: glycan-binding surface protein, partial [Niastella sp.]
NGGSMTGGDGSNSSTAIRLQKNDASAPQCIPAANLKDLPENWAIKFEMKVPKPWNGASLCITTDVSGYMFRFEPWKMASGPVDFETEGQWITVTLPFSLFSANSATLGDGRGAPLSDLTKLFGPTGASHLYLYMHNYGAGPTETGYYVGIDNVRIVKIK